MGTGSTCAHERCESDPRDRRSCSFNSDDKMPRLSYALFMFTCFAAMFAHAIPANMATGTMMSHAKTSGALAEKGRTSIDAQTKHTVDAKVHIA